MKNKLLALAAVVALVLVPLPASAGPEPGSALGITIALPSKTQDVRVVNDALQPVPVIAAGTTQVEGTVAVSELPPVSIAGTPEVLLAEGTTVALADESTTVLLTRTDTLPAGASGGFATIDVSQMASIRVMATCGRSAASWTPGECGNVELRIYDTSCAGCTLAAFTLAEDVSEEFDTPGTSLTFGGINRNAGGEPLQVTYKVFGRRH